MQTHLITVANEDADDLISRLEEENLMESLEESAPVGDYLTAFSFACKTQEQRSAVDKVLSEFDCQDA